MVSNILGHLENIKIYTDFKRTGFDTLEIFWDHIDNGGSIYDLEDKKYVYEVYYTDPTEEELRVAQEEQERRKNIDEYEVYSGFVSESVQTMLEYDHAEIPEAIELDFLYDLIKRNTNLKKYLATTKKLVHEYAVLAENELPENFFEKIR